MWARVTGIGLKGMDGYRVSVEVELSKENNQRLGERGKRKIILAFWRGDL